MPNDSDLDDRRVVVDGVDNPVITDPDMPKVIGAPQFFASRRSSLLGERVDLRRDAFNDGAWERLEFLLRGTSNPHLMHDDASS